MNWTPERAEQFVGTMRVLLAHYEGSLEQAYPTTIEQTVRSLALLSDEKVKTAMDDFSEAARKAINVVRLKLRASVAKPTPQKSRLGLETPYRTPASKKVNWIQYIDEKTQMAYYENQLTGETTWDRPPSQFKVDGYDYVEWEEDAFSEEEFLDATKKAFDMVDRDHNGLIDEKELKAFMKATHHEDQFSVIARVIPKIQDLDGFRHFWDRILEDLGTTKTLALFKDEFGFSIGEPAETPNPTPSKESKQPDMVETPQK